MILQSQAPVGKRGKHVGREGKVKAMPDTAMLGASLYSRYANAHIFSASGRRSKSYQAMILHDDNNQYTEQEIQWARDGAVLNLYGRGESAPYSLGSLINACVRSIDRTICTDVTRKLG